MPHAQARAAFVEVAGVMQAAPAPRFSRSARARRAPRGSRRHATAKRCWLEAGFSARRGAGAARSGCVRVPSDEAADADESHHRGRAQAPPPPRQSASLIVLRDGADGLEVLMLRRAERAGDQNSGAAVFPGGLSTTQDRARTRSAYGLDDARASARLGWPAGGLDYWVAAIRECFEEAGLLFAVDAGGQWVDLDAARRRRRARRMRHDLHAGRRRHLAALCQRLRVGAWPPIACTTSATGSRRRAGPSASTRASCVAERAAGAARERRRNRDRPS